MGWRKLTDEELFDLDRECNRRIAALQSQGAQVMGVEEHYLRTLLEEVAGPRSVDQARENHLLWVKEKLDEAEPQVARARLTQGLGQPTPPAPGWSNRGRGRG